MATIAHEQGAQAFKEKRTKKANHFGFESMGWHEWNEGFDAAKNASEKKPAPLSMKLMNWSGDYNGPAVTVRR